MTGKTVGVEPPKPYQNDGPNGAPDGADEGTHVTVSPLDDSRWLRSVVENSSENVTIVDLDGTLRYANPAFERMLGHDPKKVVGKMNVLDHVHPDDLPRVLEETEKAVSVGGVVANEVEYRFRHADGSWRWVESVGTYLLDDPDVRGVVVQTRDVTDRKRAEQAREESEERYRTLVERVPAITYVHHHKPGGFSGTTYVSPQVEAVLGYTQQEYTSAPEFWKSVVHPEDRGRVLAEDERTGQTREPFALDYRMLARDGRAVWLRESGTLLRTEGDGTQVWHGVMFDITELKDIERGLREAEERYRTLVERVPPTIYIQRPREGETAAYDTTYMSPRVEEVLGYPPERFVGDPAFWDEVVHPEDRQKVLAEDERTDRTGEPFSMEYRVIAEDGRTVWVRDEATLVWDDAGEPLYWLGALTEVTERRRAEEALKRSEERYRALTQNSSDLVTLMAATGVILYQSPAVERVLGYSPDELLGENAFDHVHPDDVRRAETTFAEGLKDPNRYPMLEYRFRRADGPWRWLESVGTNLLEDPAVGAYVVNSRDVTERKEAEEELRKSEERLRRLADSAFEGILITDRGVILEANLALTDMLGYALAELVGRSALEFVAPEHRDLVSQKIASGAEDPYEIVGVRKDGSSLDLEVRGRAFSYRGRGVRVTAVRDVTARKASERRLRHQAFHDSLTGLPNRKLFMDRLGHALERTRRTRGRKVAVLFMDLDGFKLVNDSLGHDTGDVLLVLVAERLRACLRPEDTLARFGGDEFVVLVEEVDTTADAVGVARRITEELRKPLVMESKNLFSSASIGVALGDARNKSPEDLLRDADTAMYRAKEEHAVYRVFHPSMYERAAGRLELDNDLRRAIEAEEFVVHYQPIVSLQTGENWGLEALVRWEHPERGLLAPSEFVPIAEESGLVVPMGEFVLEEACRWAVGWREGNPQAHPLVMSVNLSARQLARPDLAETVEGVLGKTGLEPSRLSLDVTETAYISVLEERSAALEHLKRLGVGVSIDDFGVGQSSLSYLKRLPADTLKIDRSFVGGVGDGLEDTAIVRMVVELAHTLGMKVVAEGVEGRAQAALLSEIECDFAQGYHFSRPLPPDAVSEFLAN